IRSLMFLFSIFFFFLCPLAAEVCYDRLGCFTDNIPWAGTAERPIAKLPWPPERIDIRFMLYTRQNALSYQEITPVDPSTISASNYKGGRTTRMITHGFVDKGDENWLKDMCKMMLQVEDINCICIDWKGGSRTLYTQSAQNIRVIGAEIAYLIKLLMNDYNQKPADFHFIGHSLGAHCGGEVGRRIKGLGRITGLDPAEPYFQGTPIEVRLDPSDAIFVDVIHTDSAPMIPYLGFGMSQAVGHLDFYPNGGEQMPGCGKNVASQIVDIDGIWEGTRDFVACNHLRSYKYYADSILNPDGFLGYRCPTVEAFEAGNCFPCPTKGCPMMGHYAPQVRPATNAEQFKFFLNTGEARPFTRVHLKRTKQVTYGRGRRETKPGQMKGESVLWVGRPVDHQLMGLETDGKALYNCLDTTAHRLPTIVEDAETQGDPQENVTAQTSASQRFSSRDHPSAETVATVEEMGRRSGEHLNAPQQEQLQQLLRDFVDIFAARECLYVVPFTVSHILK
ncbi:LIPR1 protein, partial [Polypterus senegalus]